MSISLYTKLILWRVAAGERLFVRHRSWSASFYISTDVWGKPEWLDGERIIADLTHVKGEILGREILKWNYIKSHNVYIGDDCMIDEYELTDDGVAFIENLYTTPPDSGDGALIQAQRELNEAKERLRQAKDEQRLLIEQHRRLDQLSKYLLSLSPEEGKAWIDKHIKSSRLRHE